MAGDRASTRRGLRRRWPARALLLLIEGPYRLWWVLPTFVIGGLILLAGADDVAEGLIGGIMLLLGLIWTVARLSVYQYYKALARTTDFSRCVRCGYSLEGLGSGVCPECGTDSRALTEWAGRVTGGGG